MLVFTGVFKERSTNKAKQREVGFDIQTSRKGGCEMNTSVETLFQKLW